MRIWSVHPQYLDSKGLVALWRETLLAQHVLMGKTQGYKNHPQLDRFKQHPKPVEAVNAYLQLVFEEATRRGYQFDGSKIGEYVAPVLMPVTSGRVAYEVGAYETYTTTARSGAV